MRFYVKTAVLMLLIEEISTYHNSDPFINTKHLIFLDKLE